LSYLAQISIDGNLLHQRMREFESLSRSSEDKDGDCALAIIFNERALLADNEGGGAAVAVQEAGAVGGSGEAT
jgi:hypothetical protein